MTRKDFQLIADIIANLPPATGGEALEDFGPHLVDRNLLVDRFANALEHTNDRFDRDRFKTAATG
jgi:hypothetical protein